MTEQFAESDLKFAALLDKKDVRFKTLMTAIAEWKAQELTHVRRIAALSERVAVLESQRH